MIIESKNNDIDVFIRPTILELFTMGNNVDEYTILRLFLKHPKMR